jgi:hypothetical protein
MHWQVWVENLTYLDDLCIEKDGRWVLKSVRWDCKNWILPMQNRSKQQALLSVVLNLQVSYKMRNFVITRVLRSMGLWCGYINVIITVLDIINRPVFYVKNCHFEDWILSSSSGEVYSVRTNRKSYPLSLDTRNNTSWVYKISTCTVSWLILKSEYCQNKSHPKKYIFFFLTIPTMKQCMYRG